MDIQNFTAYIERKESISLTLIVVVIMKKIFSSFVGYSILAAGSISASWLIATPAQAAVFGFDNISHNSSINEDVGERQLSFDVTDASGGENLTSSQVLFKFNNKGDIASSITQIYFDHNKLAPLLKGVSSITPSGTGVSFAAEARGNLNLPAGNNVGFTADFGVKANTPTSQKGVNPGEYVSVLFDLEQNVKLKNILDALASDTFRVGVHVQAFASNGGSEAFVSNPVAIVPKKPTPVKRKVPEGTTILALAMFGATSWKLKKKKQS
jgi:hypothetical protein